MYLHFSIHRAELSKALPFALYGGGSTRTQKAAEYLSVASAFACGVEYRGSEHSRGPMSTCLASHARSGSCRFGFVGTVTHSASWPGHVKSKIRLVFTAESQLKASMCGIRSRWVSPHSRHASGSSALRCLEILHSHRLPGSALWEQCTSK